MSIWQRVKKVHGRIVLVKRLVWFVVNFVGMMAPFRQIRGFIGKMYEKIREITHKIGRLLEENGSLQYLREVERQSVGILLLVAIVVIYLNLKFRKPKPDSQPPTKRIKQLDQLSQKTIIPQTRMIRQQKQQVDSCYEQLHNGMHMKATKQDKVFLAILERYQLMRAENEEEEIENERDFSKNNNKLTLDNSTEEGGFKASLRRIPTTHANKKDGDDLNRSSVL